MTTNDKTAPVSQQPDQNAIIAGLMNRMKMHGMARGLPRESGRNHCQAMTRLLPVRAAQPEWDYRRAAAGGPRLKKTASFPLQGITLENRLYGQPRLDRNQMERLASLDCHPQRTESLHKGSAGTGKSFLACALGHEAAKEEYAHSTPTQPSFSDCSRWPRSRTVLRLNSRKIDDAGF